MKEYFITATTQGEIPNDRSYTEMVGAQHKANDDNDKPLKRGLSGETRTEGHEKVNKVFDHIDMSITRKSGRLLSITL